jgi:hypothetical protein
MKLTMNAFIANYEGDQPEILSLKADYVQVRGRQSEKSLTAKYGSNAHATWAAFTAAGGK